MRAGGPQRRLRTALQAAACITLFGLLAAVAVAAATAQDVDSLQDAPILADPPRGFTPAAAGSEGPPLPFPGLSPEQAAAARADLAEWDRLAAAAALAADRAWAALDDPTADPIPVDLPPTKIVPYEAAPRSKVEIPHLAPGAEPTAEDAVASTNRASPEVVGSGPVEVVDERLCGVSDDSSLRAAAVETPQGHWSHEDWLAKASSQNAVPRIHEALGDLPAVTGSGAASTPETETLASRAANGIVGVTADNVTQRFVVVVDSSVVSLDAVGEALRKVDSELRIEVRPSCHSIAQLAAAEDTLKARQWHPSASEASYGYHMDPATASFKVTFSSGDVDVAQSLKDLLGDTVEITYGEPSRLGRLDEHSENVVPD